MKQFYYAVATSNFKTGDNITLAEMIADKLRQQGINNVVTNKKDARFLTFSDGYKFIRIQDLHDTDPRIDWSDFRIEEYIVTETMAETIAFRETYDDAAYVRITKYTKPTGACIFLVSVMNA